ncbi:MAG: GNAT family N-acetyltransferase, partial [Acidobacteriota bacterium]
ALGRPNGDVLELPGVTIASAAVTFRMFNAAFLSGPVTSPDELEQRLALARSHFEARGQAWAFWFCEDWLEKGARRRLSALCAPHGLRMVSELPGMAAVELAKPGRSLPAPELRRVESISTLMDFRSVCSLCFHVPPHWFAEVFRDDITETAPEFVCWVAYDQGRPIATAATLAWDGVIGLYNIATAPGFRGRGIAEATTRHAIGAARAEAGPLPLILQSTSLGHRMYQKLGFREVTRILVFNSVP